MKYLIILKIEIALSILVNWITQLQNEQNLSE